MEESLRPVTYCFLVWREDFHPHAVHTAQYSVFLHESALGQAKLGKVSDGCPRSPFHRQVDFLLTFYLPAALLHWPSDSGNLITQNPHPLPARR